MKRMFRLAYISTDCGIPIFGRKAGSVHAQEILRALAAKGALIDLFAAAVGDEVPEDLKNVTVRKLPLLTNDLCGPGKQKEVLERVTDLNRKIRTILTSASKNGAFDLFYERYSLWSYAAMEVSGENCTASVLEVNAPLIREQNCYRTPINSEVALEVARRAFRSATIILAVSAEIAKELSAFPEARNKVLLLPNGVNPERFLPNATVKREWGRSEYRIGFVGGFKPWHGLDMLIEAFSRLNAHNGNSKLILIGDGPELSRIQEIVRYTGISAAVEFLGSVPPSEIPSLLQTLDVAVAPYEDLPQFYFSPLKVLEYMAAGLPVVASRIGQISEIIEHGRTGWLVAPGDAQEMGDAFINLTTNPNFRRSLGANARKQAERLHCWKRIAEKLLNEAFDRRYVGA